MRRILPGIIALGLSWGVAGFARAQQDPPIVGVQSFEIAPPETGRLICLKLKFGEENFSLISPRQWRTEPTPTGVRFRSLGHDATILIALTRIPLAGTNLDLEGPVRRELGARDFTPLMQFDQPTGLGGGRASDFTWQIYGARKKGRVVMVHAGKTAVSFLLMCPREDFNARQQEFGALLGSFQSAIELVRKN